MSGLHVLCALVLLHGRLLASCDFPGLEEAWSSLGFLGITKEQIANQKHHWNTHWKLKRHWDRGSMGGVQPGGVCGGRAEARHPDSTRSSPARGTSRELILRQPHRLWIQQVERQPFPVRSAAFRTCSRNSCYNERWEGIGLPRFKPLLWGLFPSTVSGYFYSAGFQWFILYCDKVIYNYTKGKEKPNI